MKVARPVRRAGRRNPPIERRQGTPVRPYTKLAGPERGIYYELFVIIDIYSRYIVGWIVAAAETGELAQAFIADAIDTQEVGHSQLTLHADRGSSMTSKPVSQLLVDLGVTRSHSRPSVSNDNPYSEAQFKTLKYCPEFPDRFGSIEDARTFCAGFFEHYTTSTGTQASGSTPQHRSTTAPPPKSGPTAPRRSPLPTKPTRPDSGTSHPPHPNSRPRPGSTNPTEKHSYKTTRNLSHSP